MNKVDVIIPCYNSAQYLCRTMNSVLSQTYDNINIVVIDDGSSDGTYELLIREYSKYVTILTHSNRSNKRSAASLNLGIKSTSGEYIALLDSDDLYYPDKIKQQVDVLDNNMNIGLVYTNGYAINESDNILYSLFSDNHLESNKSTSIVINNYISAGSSTVMFRRSLLDIVGLFDENLYYSYDHDMWIRFKEVTSFYYLNYKLMAYRKHSSQQSKKRNQWDESFTVLKKAMQRHKYGILICLKRTAVIYYRIGEYEMYNRNIKSLWYYMLSGILDPKRAIYHIFSKIR